MVLYLKCLLIYSVEWRMVNELKLSAPQNVINSNCISQHCNNMLLIFMLLQTRDIIISGFLYFFCSELCHLENICGEMICTKIIINVVFNMGKLYNVEHCMNFTNS